MSRKQLGFLALLLGLALIIGATLFGVRGILGAIKGFDPVATVASPESIELTITEPGTFTLWHDHQTWHNGRSVSHPPTLPGGFTFDLITASKATAPEAEESPRSATSLPGIPDPVPFKPLSSGSTQTLSINSRQAVAVGAFDIAAAGTYRFTPHNPAGDVRVFSLSKGEFMDSLTGTIGRGLLAAVLGLLGFALAITGILMLTLGRKKNSPPSLSPS